MIYPAKYLKHIFAAYKDDDLVACRWRDLGDVREVVENEEEKELPDIEAMAILSKFDNLWHEQSNLGDLIAEAATKK